MIPARGVSTAHLFLEGMHCILAEATKEAATTCV